MNNFKAIEVKSTKGKGKQIVFSSSGTYYDDCPICRAMKKAEEEGRSLSSSEIEKAFEEANKKNSN